MSDSDSSDDDLERGTYVSAAPLGEPYSRYQGSYLFNLQKLLNDAAQLQVEHAVRWHGKISNAIEINWSKISACFDTVHPVLVSYKLSRKSNRFKCVRPTMNRKLREWNFSMVPSTSAWVTYVYASDAFHRDTEFGMLPTHRRQRHI